MTSFEHLGDEVVHRGYIWHVAVGTYRAPDGSEFQRDVVRSPGAVAAVPLYTDEHGETQVVLVRQYRAPFDAVVVEVPAGMRDVPDEPLDRTASRELVEEIGYAPGRLEHLIDMYPSVGMTDAVLSIFLATELEHVGSSTHGPEEDHMEVVHLPLAAAVEMVLDGRIHDAKTVIGLLLAERRVRSGR